MGKSTFKLTRKIQLTIDLPTKEQRKEQLDMLYNYRYHCFKIANLVVPQLYLQQMNEDFVYLSDDIKAKLDDTRKLNGENIESGSAHSICRMVCDKFEGELPSDLLLSLSSSLLATFNEHKSDYEEGLCSLRNYRKDMGIPVMVNSMSKVIHDPDKTAFCFSVFSIPFRTYLGKDFTDRRKLMKAVVKGEVKLCDSTIILDGGKIFWLTVFEVERVKQVLSPYIVAQASPALEHPIVVKTSKAKFAIGNREEFLYRKLALQGAYKRGEKAVACSKSEKERKAKLKILEKLKGAEDDYVSKRLDLYSRKLIEFCLKNRAGKLKLLSQEDKLGIAKDEDFVLNERYYDRLKSKIGYRAEKVGIELLNA